MTERIENPSRTPLSNAMTSNAVFNFVTVASSKLTDAE